MSTVTHHAQPRQYYAQKSSLLVLHHHPHQHCSQWRSSKQSSPPLGAKNWNTHLPMPMMPAMQYCRIATMQEYSSHQLARNQSQPITLSLQYVYNDKIAADIYDRAMLTEVTVTQRELLLLSLEDCSQVHKAISAKCNTANNAVKEIHTLAKDDALPFDYSITTSDHNELCKRVWKLAGASCWWQSILRASSEVANE